MSFRHGKFGLWVDSDDPRFPSMLLHDDGEIYLPLFEHLRPSVAIDTEEGVYVSTQWAIDTYPEQATELREAVGRIENLLAGMVKRSLH